MKILNIHLSVKRKGCSNATQNFPLFTSIPRIVSWRWRVSITALRETDVLVSPAAFVNVGKETGYKVGLRLSKQ